MMAQRTLIWVRASWYTFCTCLGWDSFSILIGEKPYWILQSHFPVSRSNIQINPFWLFILLLAPYCMGFGLGNREIHCRWWDVPMWCLTRAVAVAFRCFLGRASAGHIERMSPSSGCRAHWIPTTRSLRAQAQGEGSRFHGFGTKLTSFCYPKYYAYHGPRIHEYINYNIYIYEYCFLALHESWHFPISFLIS